jgi:hypothetical protein
MKAKQGHKKLAQQINSKNWGATTRIAVSRSRQLQGFSCNQRLEGRGHFGQTALCDNTVNTRY